MRRVRQLRDARCFPAAGPGGERGRDAPGPAGEGPAGEEDAPKVMAAGTSPIPPELQAAFCKDQVAFMYDAEPQDAVAQERVVAADGSATVDVVIDKGSGGRKTYVCSLGADNRFVGVTAAGAGLL